MKPKNWAKKSKFEGKFGKNPEGCGERKEPFFGQKSVRYRGASPENRSENGEKMAGCESEFFYKIGKKGAKLTKIVEKTLINRFCDKAKNGPSEGKIGTNRGRWREKRGVRE